MDGNYGWWGGIWDVETASQSNLGLRYYIVMTDHDVPRRHVPTPHILVLGILCFARRLSIPRACEIIVRIGRLDTRIESPLL